MGELVPRKDMVKQAMMGIGGIGGGIAIFLLGGLPWPAGMIVGGIIAVIGFAISTSKKDRTAGLMTLGAGALLAISKIPGIGPLAGFVLGVAGVGLLLVGGLSIYKFIKNLNARR
ncbi:MAG: hypothetical protein JXB88_12870 [Spirochaetales bacterium]|nr:hypothetical protein [Spirochaetales bacterium]